MDEDLLYGFFSPSTASQSLGKQFISRLKIRQADKDISVSMETVKAQAIAREK
jgi:hypothetical protein